MRIHLPLAFFFIGCLAPPVASPMTTTTQETPILVPQNAHNKVDVLFMIDNSSSMDAMQSELRARFGDFFQVFSDLATAGTYADLHIGVVTSDYGAGDVSTASCAASPGGQKGLLQPVGAAAQAGCKSPMGAPYIEYTFTGSGATSNLPSGQDLLATFTCMASVGASGCGFEHQLESVYAALHDTNFNAGFLRDDAFLTVVFVTNEDDASAPPSTDIFDPNKSSAYGAYDTYRQTRFGVECGMPPMLAPYAASVGPLTDCKPAPNLGPTDIGKEYDVTRYIDFFTKPKALGGVKDDPKNVILVAIDAPENPFQVILSTASSGNGKPPTPSYVTCSPLEPPSCLVRLQHSCQNQAAPAFFGDPPIRLNTVVKSVERFQVASICGDDETQQPSYTAALQSLGKLISNSFGQGCIPARVADPDTLACLVEDVTTDSNSGVSSIVEVPRCTSGVFPCWKVEEKSQCATLSPQSLGVTVDYNGAAAPANTTARVECDTIAEPADMSR